MRTLYNILFLFFFVLASPYYFWRMLRRGNWQAGFGERFGEYDTKLKQALTNRHALWLHAVSVGEVNICTHLIRALEPRVPNAKIVVSTTTTTGMGELKKKLPTHVSKIYYPVDRRKYVSRAQSLISPEAIVLVEAEIWPNFIWRAQQQRIPLFLVNARLSERSYRGYKRFGFLFRPLFAAFTGVGAQNETDAVRLRELGCRPEAIHIVGSLKFDAAKLDERRTLDVRGLLRQLGVPENAPLFVCGSTHAGEEAVLAEVFLRLRQRFPDLFLVLVPRHFERSREAAKDLEARGVKFAYRNEVSGHNRPNYEPGELQCLLVNTTGELKFFYEQAAVIFVGKSLTAHGGQNPIEPGALGKAMVFGPNMENFADVVRSFLAKDGAVQVKDAAGLENALADLLSNPARREQFGRNARQVVSENLGAVDRTVEMIIQGIKDSGVYVAPSPRPATPATETTR
ncbi:MAG: 3-deoxy-D-manno-octulosonic acid transferase [Verrucomicrobiota bacterium]